MVFLMVEAKGRRGQGRSAKRARVCRWSIRETMVQTLIKWTLSKMGFAFGYVATYIDNGCMGIRL